MLGNHFGVASTKLDDPFTGLFGLLRRGRENNAEEFLDSEDLKILTVDRSIEWRGRKRRTEAGRHEIDSSQINLVKNSLSSSISVNSSDLISINMYIAPGNSR